MISLALLAALREEGGENSYSPWTGNSVEAQEVR